MALNNTHRSRGRREDKRGRGGERGEGRKTRGNRMVKMGERKRRRVRKELC